MVHSQLRLGTKLQWTTVKNIGNPSDADTFKTGFCILPISLSNSYFCQVYANYFNHYGVKDQFSPAVTNKRHGNFMLDTPPNTVASNNGFTYGLDFSPTVSSIGLSFYAFLVCIKR